jgi:hypothetical protein
MLICTTCGQENPDIARFCLAFVGLGARPLVIEVDCLLEKTTALTS